MSAIGYARRRVLLIAESCNSTWTSVPLVGYNFARALAARPDLAVTLVTHVNNRAALADDPITKSARIDFIDNEWLARPLYRLTTLLRGGERLAWTLNTAMSWPSYLEFERLVFQKFARRLAAGEFDLIHRITPLTPTVPSPLAGWTRVPMIIGPLNGGLPWPRDYPDLRRQEREWLVPLRPVYKRLPYYQTTFRHLAGVIAGSRHTATEIPRWFRGRRFYLHENGIDRDRFPIADRWPEPEGRFRFITVGRLVPYKGIDLILDAMAKSPTLRQCELHVVGDGPMRQQLEEVVRRHDLSGCVRFVGWLHQPLLAAELRRSQAFVFPSLREFGGAVVLEAMACGLPTVVVDYGGPGELTDPSCGPLLPLKPRPELVASLRLAMESLATDPAKCRVFSAVARERVRRQFTWDVKAEQIVGFYGELIGGATASTVTAGRVGPGCP